MFDNFLEGLTELVETKLTFMVYYREGYRLKSAKGKDDYGRVQEKNQTWSFQSSSLRGARILSPFWYQHVTICM